MVKSITNLGRSGLYDWLIQRVSAVVVAAYVLCVTGFIVYHGSIDYPLWQQFFAHPAMQLFSLLFLLSLSLHAWIGIWTVLTDYIKPLALKVVLQLVVILLSVIYFLWGVQILWG